jgi:type III pantothenate kinase
MLLTVDVGNTNIVFGVFSGKKILASWRVETKSKTLYFQHVDNKARNEIKSAIVSSVVPNIDQHLSRQIEETFGIKPVFVSAKNIPIKIKMRDRAEIGADRLVNAYAAKKLYGGAMIIVDFGTATTFCAVNARGEYLGGAIAPGIGLSKDALHYKTAKLPLIDFGVAKDVIGKNTKAAMLSGLYFGYVSLVEGMIKRFKAKVGKSAKVIATGGYSALIGKKARIFDIIDSELTLKGLRMLWEEINV